MSDGIQQILTPITGTVSAVHGAIIAWAGATSIIIIHSIPGDLMVWALDRASVIGGMEDMVRDATPAGRWAVPSVGATLCG